MPIPRNTPLVKTVTTTNTFADIAFPGDMANKTYNNIAVHNTSGSPIELTWGDGTEVYMYLNTGESYVKDRDITIQTNVKIRYASGGSAGSATVEIW
jgi:hypothetical protein